MSNTKQMSGHIETGSAIAGYSIFLISKMVINASELRHFLIGLLGAVIYAVVGWYIRQWLDYRKQRKIDSRRKREWEDKHND